MPRDDQGNRARLPSVAWEQLRDRKPWIRIKFGQASEVDYRQPFVEIGSFDATGWSVEQFGFEPSAAWGSVDDAAAMLGLSRSTIRRRVDNLAETHGEALLTFTDGRHRRINLEYLQQMLSD